MQLHQVPELGHPNSAQQTAAPSIALLDGLQLISLGGIGPAMQVQSPLSAREPVQLIFNAVRDSMRGPASC